VELGLKYFSRTDWFCKNSMVKNKVYALISFKTIQTHIYEFVSRYYVWLLLPLLPALWISVYRVTTLGQAGDLHSTLGLNLAQFHYFQPLTAHVIHQSIGHLLENVLFYCVLLFLFQFMFENKKSIVTLVTITSIVTLICGYWIVGGIQLVTGKSILTYGGSLLVSAYAGIYLSQCAVHIARKRKSIFKLSKTLFKSSFLSSMYLLIKQLQKQVRGTYSQRRVMCLKILYPILIYVFVPLFIICYIFVYQNPTISSTAHQVGCLLGICTRIVYFSLYKK
jgi:membrane associated rhomboid family serine protease